MKILLLAGEESGLLYAREIAARLAGHEVRGYADYGFETADLAVMGFWAVLRRLFFFLRVKRTMMRAIDAWKPDAVCTVDYPGMNLTLAAHAKSRGIRTVHVVCPQVWAWRPGRIPKIERSLDRLCCFFPFEPALFRDGFAVFVGHPLARQFAALPPVKPSAADVRTVAVLPGSRGGEIARILPPLLEAAAILEKRTGKGVRFVVPAVHARAEAHIRRIVNEAGRNAPAALEVRLGGARNLLRTADCAAVASGTATLEAALAGCPTVLVYRVSAILASIARRVIRGTRFIGLANVVWERCGIAGPQPMPELLQEDFTPDAVADRLETWLSDESARRAAKEQLSAVTARLGTSGDPIGMIADEVLRKM